MTTNPPDTTALENALRATHRSVLGLLVLCAVAILAHGLEGDEPPPDATLTTLGVGTALVAVVARRVGSSPAISPRNGVWLALGALLAAGCLGLLGARLAFAHGAPESGLLFTLAGGIFAIGRPGPVRAG